MAPRRSRRWPAATSSSGEKVFEETPERRSLRLRESKVVGDGVLVLVYERAT